MADPFVPLDSLIHTHRTPDAVIEEIRRLYFRTSAATISNDLMHAVALLKSLPTEAERERANVYMDGLAEMRREWALEARRARRSRH